MSYNVNQKILLVGAGEMAIEYAKVLVALNVDFEVVGRGSKSSRKFSKIFSKHVIEGGINKYLDNNKQKFEYAIVVVNREELANVAKQLIKNETKYILLEKPGGLNIAEIKDLASFGKDKKTRIFIAYNRRFFASTLKAAEIIEKDGGLTSCFFEFTEWSDKIEKSKLPDSVKENWVLANSSHVIDLCFYISGKPKVISSYTDGKLLWHPTASRFAGSGITENGVLFSYRADWNSPGRWAVEFLTKTSRLYLTPLEKLYIQKKGELNRCPVHFDESNDINHKPGLYKQTMAFIYNNSDLLDIREHSETMWYYDRIINGQKYLK